MASMNLMVLALGASLLFASPAAAQSEISSGMSPIRKVVTLIEEMKVTVEADAKEDLETYDKYMCWCETNEKAKTKAIEDAQMKIEELSAFIEAAAAKTGELKTEIGALTEDIAADKDALATATATREKENEAFEAESADMTETIALLKEAVTVLDKVNFVQKSGGKVTKELAQKAQDTAALLQVRRSTVQGRHPQFASVMQKDLFDMLGAITPEGFLPKRKAASFQQTALQAEQPSAGGAAAGAKSYNARSGQIFGLLSEMQEETERDLAEAKKAEASAVEMYENLKEAKEAEIAAATEQKKAKEAELADLQNKNAKAKKDLEATEDALGADTEFLANMKKDCKIEDEEYKKRVEIRSKEIIALAETLKILNEDDARETFGKTISLMQVKSESRSRVQLQDRASQKAMERIAEVAKKHNNWALVSLAVRVRLDAFTKVKETMDKMLAELKKQQEEEYEKHEQCKKDIDETEDEIKVKTNVKEDLDDKHKGLTNQLETLTTDIKELKDEETEMEISLKQAGEQRKKENGVYQTSIMDQRAAINILNKALKRLKDFYTFVQQPGQPVAPPPAKGKAYQKSAGAGGVVQLIQMIISDAEQEEAEMQIGEQKAQEAYGTFVKDTTASIEADRKAIEEKQGQVAETETAKSETEEAQLANNQQLDKLKDLLKAHHVDCDFVIKYFDLRQQARQEEMDSITDAKAILSGADFGK